MSILQITNGHGELAWWAPFKIIALLTRPDDEMARAELFEALAANADHYAIRRRSERQTDCEPA
jgi:hypothetical protein